MDLEGVSKVVDWVVMMGMRSDSLRGELVCGHVWKVLQ